MKFTSKTILIPLCALVFTAGSPVSAQPQHGNISMTADGVFLMDILRIIMRSSGVTIHVDAEDPVFERRVTFSADDQPWTDVLRGILRPHGMVLLENEPAPGAYTIVRATDPGAAARLQAARESNETIRAALEALRVEDPGRAKALLEAAYLANQNLLGEKE